jgi:hypothetical protein
MNFKLFLNLFMIYQKAAGTRSKLKNHPDTNRRDYLSTATIEKNWRIKFLKSSELGRMIMTALEKGSDIKPYIEGRTLYQELFIFLVGSLL